MSKKVHVFNAGPCLLPQVAIDNAIAALKDFSGTDRRFEKKGEYKGVTIIDDYAHHPTEMTATLKAAVKYPHKTIWCVFQPHTYSRTISFKDEICEALSLADRIVLLDIYAAREKERLEQIAAEEEAERRRKEREERLEEIITADQDWEIAVFFFTSSKRSFWNAS